MEPNPELDDLMKELGFARLSPAWAKAEIGLGLSAAAVGIRLLNGEIMIALAGGGLFVMGGYLAMAGHRSHLYQSMNKLTACLLGRMRENVTARETEDSGFPPTRE